MAKPGKINLAWERCYSDTLLEPLDLREQQLVTLTVTDEAPTELWLDTEYLAACAQETDDGVSLEEVRAGLAKIPGSLTEDFIGEREDR